MGKSMHSEWIDIDPIHLEIPDNIYWTLEAIALNPYGNSYLSLAGFEIKRFYALSGDVGWLILEDLNHDTITLILMIFRNEEGSYLQVKVVTEN